MRNKPESKLPRGYFEEIHNDQTRMILKSNRIISGIIAT
jgi:hypothetical protein